MLGSSLPTRALLFVAFALTALGNPLLPRQPEDDTANGLTRPNPGPCATVRCAAGYACTVVGRSAQCVRAERCGPTTCPFGEVCCNSSCGICTAPGGACTLQACMPPQQVCGNRLCPVGEECCNSSCGTCVKPGRGCTKQLCLPPGPKCGNHNCPNGYVCCNSSCGICTPPGGACTQQFCES